MTSLITDDGMFCRRVWIVIRALRHFHDVDHMAGPDRVAIRRADEQALSWMAEAIAA